METFVYIYDMAAFAQPSTGAPPVRREAKLFEAGDYPDKGVTILPEDLADLAARFQRPVPILIEHTDSPLALGFLESVRAEGPELFGTVALSEEANRLIEQSGADSLSLGLSPDLREIQEVSLVRHPRVPSARLFAGPIFHTKLPARKTEPDWQARAVAAERRWQEAETERQLNEWLAEGRIVPAQTRFARLLLGLGQRVTFDGESVPIGQIIRSLVESGPAVARFGEFARQSATSPAGLDHDQAEFYRRHFPDLSLEEIAKRTTPSSS